MLFSKLRNPKSPVAPDPDVYVWHEAKLAGGVTRIFFHEELTFHAIRSIIRPQLMELPYIPDIEALRTYPFYIAIHWETTKTGESVDAVEGLIENEGLRVLSELFEWHEPTVGYFHSTEEFLNKMRELGAKWRLGRYSYSN